MGLSSLLLDLIHYLAMAPQTFSNEVFEDFLPSMAQRLGAKGLLEEMRHGFCLLKDADNGLITFESLRRNSAFLGLQDLKDEDVRCMLREGDTDGDGCLSEMEFFILMFRLSPGLMEGSRRWLDRHSS